MGAIATMLSELAFLCATVFGWSPQLLGEPVEVRERSFRVVAAPRPLPLAPAADPIRFRVLIEVGLEDEAAEFVPKVLATLGDERGWARAGRPLLLVDQDHDFSVVLATPGTVDRLCAPLATGGVYSCGRGGRAVLNLRRWQLGVPKTWADDLDGYRSYMINHEVGHLLHQPHRGCDRPGAPAHVMAQQSITLDGCTPRGWPSELELGRLTRRWARRAR